MDDHRFARYVAETVGSRLIEIRDVAVEAGPVRLGATGDIEAQTLAAALLRRHRRDDAVLSEEADDDPARLDADRV